MAPFLTGADGVVDQAPKSIRSAARALTYLPPRRSRSKTIARVFPSCPGGEICSPTLSCRLDDVRLVNRNVHFHCVARRQWLSSMMEHTGCDRCGSEVYAVCDNRTLKNRSRDGTRIRPRGSRTGTWFDADILWPYEQRSAICRNEIRATEKSGHELICRMVVNLLRRADLAADAFFHDRN